jgi:hypothetical protein
MLACLAYSFNDCPMERWRNDNDNRIDLWVGKKAMIISVVRTTISGSKSFAFLAITPACCYESGLRNIFNNMLCIPTTVFSCANKADP